MADWGTGVGTISVFVDDLLDPLFIAPINLGTTLDLENGRAWVGFTAATGDSFWQTHDILSWQFRGTRQTLPYHPPTVVNGDGPHACSKKSEATPGLCAHP